MSTQNRWLWAVGIFTVGAALFAFGVPAQTILIGGLVLLCPLMMFFMGGMHDSKKDQPGASSHDTPGNERKSE